jgi:hypothetical protein
MWADRHALGRGTVVYSRPVSIVGERGGVWAGVTTLFVLGAIVLGLIAAPASAAGKQVGKPPVAVKVPERARGNVLLEWRVRRDLRRASIRVNGRRVWVRPLLQRGQRRTISLDSADGLRFGRNEIVVRVRPRQGRRATIRHTVVVRRDAPLPAIRQPRGAIAGRAVRLDGRRTRAARNGELGYRWRIVRAPRGAHATLRGASRRRPRLLATVPGRYRLALTVHERGGDKGSAALISAGACALPASPLSPLRKGDRPGPLASLPLGQLPAGALTVNPRRRPKPARPGPNSRATAGCATAVEDVKLKPNAMPIGVAFDSRAEYEGQIGIRIGTEFFTLPAAGEGARFVLLDAETLEVLYSATASVGLSAQRYAETLALAWASERNVLIVASGLEGCCPNDSEDSGQGFTLVENYTRSGGTPSENQGQPLSEGGVRGQQRGWLQPGIPLDGAPALYALVSPDRVPFDTQASELAVNANTITVGGQSYTVHLPAGATAGFEVLVTNPALQPLFGSPAAFGTNGPEGEKEELAMANLIYQATQGGDATVFVQSIGSPVPVSANAAGIANNLETLGANRWVYLSLGGEGGYSFVGTTDAEALGLEPTSAEASSLWSRRAGGNGAEGEGALRGELRRTRTSAYAPQLAGSLGAPNYELDQVTYQPGVPWPQTQNGGRIAATQWLAEALELTPGPGSCYQPPQPDFRSSYCDDSISPLALQRELEKISYPAAKVAEFSDAEFEEVRTQLGRELGYVANVRALTAALKEPLGEQNPAVEANKVASEIIDAIPAPRASATSGDLGLASSILYAASDVPEVGEALGPIAAILDIASQLTQENGQPSPDWTVETSAGEIGGKVQQRLRLMTGSLEATEDILVSDWGKLSTAATAAKSKWGISSAGIAEEASTIELGISQWMWTALAPAAFELVRFDLEDFERVGQEPTSELYCVYSRAPEEWYPWRNAAPQSVFYPLAGWGGGRPVDFVGFGMLSGSYSNKHSTVVSNGLGTKIFGRPSEGGAALIAPWLLERAHWNIAEPQMIDEGESPLVPGWCGIGAT